MVSNLSAVPLEQHEDIYGKIISFYDLAEKLIDTVEDNSIRDPLSHLDFIEPIVEQIEKATDLLAKEYRNYAQTGKKPGLFARKRVEKAIIDIYTATELCKAKLGIK